MAENKIASKIKKIIFFGASIVGFEVLLEKFLNANQYVYVLLMLGVLISGLSFYMIKHMKASKFHLISFFLVSLNFGAYVFFKLLNPTLRVSSMFTDLGFSLDQINNYLTINLFTYGVFQLLAGYILSKFKLGGYVFMMFLSSIAISLQGISSADNIIFLRALCGIFLSGSGVIISYYPVTYWKKENLTFLLNAIVFLGVKIAVVVNTIVSQKIYSSPKLWKNLLIYFGYTLMFISIIAALFISLFGKKYLNKEKINEENNVTEVEGDNKSIISEFLYLIKKDKRIFIICVLSFASVGYFFFFRATGCLIDFSKGFFPTIDPLFFTNFFNNLSAYVPIILAMMTTILSLEALIVGCLSINIISVVSFIFWGSKSFFFANLMILGNVLGWSSADLGSLLIGKDLGEKKSSGMIFALFGACAMLIGSFLIPKIGILLINNGLLKSLNLAESSFIAMCQLSVLVIISFISGLMLYRLKKNNNK